MRVRGGSDEPNFPPFLTRHSGWIAFAGRVESSRSLARARRALRDRSMARARRTRQYHSSRRRRRRRAASLRAAVPTISELPKKRNLIPMGREVLGALPRGAGWGDGGARSYARGWMGGWWGALLRAGLGVRSRVWQGGGGRSHGVTHVSPRCLTSSKEPSTQPLTLIPHLSCMSAYPCDCCCVDACIYPPALNPKP